MIEILGVLAIIGVLSIGGIAGYTKAMEKINTDKLVVDISTTAHNIKNCMPTRSRMKIWIKTSLNSIWPPASAETKPGKNFFMS